MRFFIIVCSIALFSIPSVNGQGFAFGFKGGPTIATQNWSGFGGQDPLLSLHGDAYIASLKEDNQFAFFAMAGYHIKGSSLRFRRYFNPVTMEEIAARTNRMEFHNVSLVLGAQKKIPFRNFGKLYYGFGVRGDYTVDTELGGYYSIYEGLENKWNYGVTVQAGFEIPFGELVAGLLEFSVSPDFSRQIHIFPQDTGYSDPFSGQPIILPEQSISNVVFEISLGLNFIREIIYID